MILFENEGLIDLDAIRLSGVSVKVVDNPIGQFGTGLKYAIAILLREGCSITLFRGTKAYVLSTRNKVIRGKNFDVVYMNNEQLGFTTHQGSTWKPWQAFRELWCNAKDECGYTTEIDNDPNLVVGKKGHTRIFVKGKAMDEAWKDRANTVLQSTPLYVSPGLEVHSGNSEWVYYRGIRAHKLRDTSLYTYNIISEFELTEDRMISHSYSVTSKIISSVLKSSSVHYIQDVLTAEKGFYEQGFDYSYYGSQTPSEQFVNVCSALKKERKLKGSANALFYEYSMSRYSGAEDYEVKPSGVELHIIKEAGELLRKSPFPGAADIRLVFNAPLGENFDPSSHAKSRGNAIVMEITHIHQGAKHLASEILIGYLRMGGKFDTLFELSYYVITGEDIKIPPKLNVDNAVNPKLFEMEDIPF